MGEYDLMVKGKYTLAILKAAGGAVLDSVQLFEAFLRAGYGASGMKIETEFSKIEMRNAQIVEELTAVIRLKSRYHKILYHLKKDGLLEKRRDGFIKITPGGRERLAILEKRNSTALPSLTYKTEKSGNVTIVVYDIPEKWRKKRNWLRSALSSIGLKMIQKSVWLGRVKIPKTFLDNIKDLRLIEYIEIFEVSKTGTLRHVA